MPIFTTSPGKRITVLPNDHQNDSNDYDTNIIGLIPVVSTTHRSTNSFKEIAMTTPSSNISSTNTINSSSNNQQFTSKSNYRQKKYKYSTRERSIAKGRDPLISLNMNLDYLGKSGQKQAARIAEELLSRIEKLHEEGYYDVNPDSVSYNSVMNAYAISTDIDNPIQEVERLFQRMEDLYAIRGENSTIKPTVVTFNTVISSLTRHGEIERAEDILNRMESYYEQGRTDLGPNTVSFNILIDAYAKARNPQKAEDLLRRMMKISFERGLQYGQANDECSIKADTIAFNTVLQAWSMSRQQEAVLRVEQLLNHMLKLYHSGNKFVKPDCVSYTTVISTFAGSGDPNASQKALELLHRMEQECALGDKDICPSIVTYTSAINALARSGEKGSADKAHNLLTQVLKQYYDGNEDMKPDLICYSSVIDAHAKSGEEHAAEKAIELLDQMITQYEKGNKDIKPNTKTYCSVISALGRSKMYGAADMAQRLLDDCERMYAFGNDDVAPNTILFNCCIDAWARSSFVFKAERAQELLHRMEQEYSEGNIMYKPDIVTYNSVISAAANSFGDMTVKKKAFLIALEAFKKIQALPDVHQSSRTYFLFVKAVRKLTSPGPEREVMLKKVVEYCCRDGMLNQNVFSQLELACGKNSFAKILKAIDVKTQGLALTWENIPTHWKKNG